MFYALVAVLAVVAAIVVFQRPQRGLLLLAAGLPFDGLRIPFGLPDWTSNWVEGMVVLTLAAAVVARPGLARPQPGRAWPGWVPGLIGLALLGVASLRLVDAFQVMVGLKVGFQAVSMAFVAWRCPLSRTERDRLVTILMVDRSDLCHLGDHPAGHRTGRSCATWAIGTTRPSASAAASCGRSRPSSSRSLRVLPDDRGAARHPDRASNDPIRLRNRVFLCLLPLYGIGMLVAVVRGAWIGTAVGLLYPGRPAPPDPPARHPGGRDRAAARSEHVGLERHQDHLGRDPPHRVERQLLRDRRPPPRCGHRHGRRRRAEAQRPRGGDPGVPVRGVDGETAFQPDNQYFLYTLDLGLAALWFYLLVLFAAFRTASKASDRTGGDDSAFALGTGAVIIAYAVAGWWPRSSRSSPCTTSGCSSGSRARSRRTASGGWCPRSCCGPLPTRRPGASGILGSRAATGVMRG